MVTDQDTDFVYFSGLLPSWYPVFFKGLERILKRLGIRYGLLPLTRDIWCRDYMPIQIDKDNFVQFKYEPSYLFDSKKHRDTITNTTKVCQAIGIKPLLSDIRLDGGNLIRSKTKVVLTSRVFSENPEYSKMALLAEIKRLLKVEKVIVVPECPGDPFGHADGMIRFLGDAKNKEQWLVNDFTGESGSFCLLFNQAVANELLKTQLIPYNPFNNVGNDAKGVYINYLQVGQRVIYPLFGLKEDKLAHECFTSLFGSDSVGIRANEIAQEGGVLNCVSWNILNTELA